MALAPFFKKAALSGSHFLRNVSPDAFASLAKDLSIGLVFDDHAVQSWEGQTSVELVANLLARLYPTVVPVPLGPKAASQAVRIRSLLRNINPDIDLQTARLSATVVVGNSRPDQSAPAVYVGSNAWQARVSMSSPVGSGGTNNPFGASAAACLACAHLFRFLFSAHLPAECAPQREVSLSLFDYSSTQAAEHIQPDMHVPECVLVGVGAVGNGAVWVLSRTAAKGRLILVDGEKVDDTNPQRYVLTDMESPGQWKVELGASHLKTSKFEVEIVKDDWAGFCKTRLPKTMPFVAVGVDSAFDRCAIQSSLPQFAVNAWTQAGDLGVSRHSFLGDQACLACLYLPKGKKQNEDEIIAAALKFKGELMEIRNMLYFNTPLDDEWVARISRDLGKPIDQVAEFKGHPLRELYQRGICGGVLLDLQNPEAPAKVEVPMAFQSAMAGIMLAAEILMHGSRRSTGSSLATTKIDILRPLGELLSEPESKRPNCICGDADYVSVYRSMYGHYDPSQRQP